MKISYRTHPLLERIDNKRLGNFRCASDDISYIKANSEQFRNFTSSLFEYPFDTFVLSEPFIEAFEFAGKKLKHSCLWEDIQDGNYCFLSKTNNICIKVRNLKEDGVLTCEVLSFIVGKDLDLPYLRLLGHCGLWYDNALDDDGLIRSSGFEGYHSSEYLNAGLCSIEFVSKYIMLILFIKYADVEIKHLKGGQRLKEISCKYVNETKGVVNILDSKWFTTLVKSDAFKVRGHFRLQPCGEGMKDRKLIWINDFQKDGYTAPARKLSQPMNL